MKIRISLRIYVLIAMLLTGVSSIVLLSALSLQYFATGMDVAMQGGMYAQAQQYTVKNGVPVKSQQYVIASQWQDLPDNIKSHFKKIDLPFNTLNKHMVGGSWFTPPKAGFFLIKVRNRTQTVYVSSTFIPDERMLMLSPKIPHFVVIIIIAIGSILAFVVILIVVLKKVTRPVEHLKVWAGQLDRNNLNQSIPDFRFSELNSIAQMVSESLHCVQQSVEREQKFLAYASHELRTPIAVIRSNTDLLLKLVNGDYAKEKQTVGLERIERAALTMGALTETLLWLNRDDTMAVTVTDVCLAQLIKGVASELDYLIKDKQVEVQISTDKSIYPLPETVCRIVLSNIIRNAYIHTKQGLVEINQSGHKVTISNIDIAPTYESNELGFGLGLELTQRLTSQYLWHYSSKETSSGRYVYLNLISSTHQ